MGIATINPATGETVKTFEPLSSREIDQAIERAYRTFQDYRLTSFEARSHWLNRAAEILSDRKTEFGKIMTLEMGKTLASAIAEVEKCAWVCRFYADQAEQFLADVVIETDASQSYVSYQPIGIVLAVMPWNFPFWQVFRFAAPALMAGNVGLLKHASNVPQSALAIEEIIRAAGFPEGAFQTLLIGADQISRVIDDDRVRAATLTGSEAAGASLASAAGKQIKKTVLELGGTDPFIVLESADLDAAAKTATTARLINNGQSCIAAKRFIVQDSIADAFLEKLVGHYQTLKIGDPFHSDTDIGPLATPSILQELDQQVQQCVKQGATVRIGGHSIDMASRGQPELQQGNFYAPTILSDIPPGTPADQDEFFGPVALVFRVANLEEAIRVANSTPLGLGASAWTQVDAERDRLIRDLEAGCVFINGMVKSDPRLPFGGIKRSGYGRELGIQGIHEFVNIKTVWVK
ncbi:MAG: NAD-dependent succinate-semialdehyde dehydrogenase [Synechococcales cyanobacterium T60_A2020_003]|nr:NAD-dependent succinate-semialdehyde dehydrogenase [Synechococcales cyanobacterium T60_A2020_003]